MRRALTSSHILLWILLALAIASIFISLGLALSAPEYDLLYVPFASWFIFLLDGLVLILAAVLVYGWRRFDRARQQLARAEQRLDLGKASEGGHIPLIESREPLAQPEFSAVIQKLFLDRQNLSYLYVEPVAGGYGGNTTLLVRSKSRRDSAFNPCPWIVKLGVGRNVEVEYAKYKNYVHPYLTQKPGLFGYARWHDWAGIAYDLARIDLESNLQSFEQFYLEQSPDQVSRLIPEIYAPLAKSWYSSSGRTEYSNLFEEYSRLGRKKDKILEHLAKIIDKNDPYRDQLIGPEPESRPDLKPGFCAGMELPWYDPITLLRRWPGLEWKANLHRSIVHGDLNARNVLVEIAQGKPKLVWYIDFSHTGNGLSTERGDPARQNSGIDPTRGHTLRDFSRLEADCKFILTRLSGEDELVQAAAFEKALLEQGLALDPAPPVGDANLVKAWHAVRQIRRLAAGFLDDMQDPRPYYFSLVEATLPVLYYDPHQFQDAIGECYQKRYALISAGILASALPQTHNSTALSG